MSLTKLVLKYCQDIKNDRHSYSVMGSIVEEVGELNKEVNISQGDSYKTPDADGIVGESIDIIIAAIDMIYINNKDISEEEIKEIAIKKLEKWKMKVKEHKK